MELMGTKNFFLGRFLKYSDGLYGITGDKYIPKFDVWKIQVLNFGFIIKPCMIENIALTENISNFFYLFPQIYRDFLFLPFSFLSGIEFCSFNLKLLWA